MVDRTNNNGLLDKNLVVGTTAGSAGVSPTGAATYSIPITVPPGTGGMIPNLSLVYNSQGGDGFLGTGWALGGLSAITACPSNLMIDQKIEFDLSKGKYKLALDGQRLIEINNGTYNATGTEYRTEVESFTKIVQLATGFKVWTKDGRILEYGTTDDSRLKVASTYYYTWVLHKVSDRFGNYMLYHYTNDGDGFRVTRIEYTGNTSNSLVPYNEIRFLYDKDRQDKIEGYFQGDKITTNLLLNAIQVYHKEEDEQWIRVREYQLNYTYDNVSKLTEIIEYGADRTRYNSTIVEWGKSKELSFSSFDKTAILDGKQKIVGDFNGDGKADIAVYDSKIIDTYLSNGNGDFNKSSSRLTEQAAFFVNKTSVNARLIGVVSTDFNGDGLEDILTSSSYNYQNYLVGNLSSTRTSDGNGFPYQSDLVSGFYQPCLGDYDGDGKTEVLGKYDKIIFDAMDRDSQNSGKPIFECWNKDDKIYVADFNGDGRSEMLVLKSSEYYIYSLQKTGGIYSATIVSMGTNINRNSKIFLGDFNGDGKTDVICGSRTMISTGTTFVEGANLSINHNYSSSSIDKVFVADFFGKGRTSVLYVTDNYTINGESEQEEFAGNGYYIYELDANNSWQFRLELGLSSPDIDLGDFNGDGLIDICHGNMVCLNQSNPRANLVQSFTNGMNVKTQFEYKPLTDGSVYSKGEKLQVGSAFKKVQYPMYVVANVKSDNGIGGMNQIDYLYQGVLVHSAGRGFMGFTKTTIFNQAQKIKTVSTFKNNSTKFFYMVSDSVITSIGGNTISDDGTLISQITTVTKEFDYSIGNSLRFYPYTSFTSVYDKSKNILTETTYSPFFRASGSLQSSTTQVDIKEWDNTVSGAPKNLKFQTITDTYYHLDETTGDQWIVGDVSNITFNKDGFIIGTDYSKRNNTYSKQTTSYLGSEPQTIKETSTTVYYDKWGNIKKQESSYEDDQVHTRSSTIEFDSKGRLPITKTDALNNSSTTTYDYRFGVPLTQTSVNNQTVKYSYDGFGNLIATENADKSTAKVSLNWSHNDPNAPTNAFYYSDSQSSVAPTNVAKVYYDKLGRTLRTETSTVGVYLLYTDTYYNYLGQVWENHQYTFPEKGKKDTIQYRYDEYGRLRTKKAIGKIKLNEEITYDDKNRTTTYINNLTAQTNTKTTDVGGKVIKATDAGGTIAYEYYASGLPKKITSPGGDVTMQYDWMGNRTLLSDPDVGDIFATYNGFGELISQIDARKDTSTMEYDLLGRIKKRTQKEGVTVWTYDTQPNGKGLVASITSSNDKITYEYDQYSRTIKQTQQILATGKNYTHAYEFDSIGRLSKTTYPNGFATVREYTPSGYCNQIKRADNGANIWKTNPNSLDDKGRITEFVQGDNLKTQMTYNDFGSLVTKTVTNTETKTILYNLSNRYDDKTGQLTSRFNGTLQEDFEYNQTGKEDDKLNRLWNSITYLNGYPQGNVALTYDIKGNILSKSDAGTSYVYDATKVHALTQINNQTNALPDKEQNITYTPFNKVEKITEGGYEANFVYGADQQRISMKLTSYGRPLKTKYYLGDYEEIETPDGKLRQLCYLEGGAVAETEVYVGGYSSTNIYYLCTDHLGSIEMTIFPSGYVQRASFDAWGRRRNPTNGSYDLSGQGDLYFDRGYTGHEHLPQFGLINMNGRLYDPVVGRMLSPDNYVQEPNNTQNFNRYSYCLNNPLQYTDPSGELYLWDDAIVAGVGFLVGDITYGLNHNGDFFSNKALTAGAKGAGMALLGYYTGGGLGATAWQTGAYFAANTVAGAVLNSVMPSVNIPIYQSQNVNLSFSFGPSVFIGNEGSGFGINCSFNANVYGLQMNSGYGLSAGYSNLTGTYGAEFRASWQEGYASKDFTLMMGGNYFANTDGTSQMVGNITGGSGDFMFRYENDGGPLLRSTAGDGGDAYRTMALELSYGNYSLGIKGFTGDYKTANKPRTDATKDWPFCRDYPEGYYVGGNVDKYRLGALYFRHKEYRFGTNSEWVRHGAQNIVAHHWLSQQAGFRMTSYNWTPYFNYGTRNQYTSW